MAKAFDARSISPKLNSSSSSDRIAALRCIKNDVVGHSQRKERWVRRGIIRILVNIVTSAPDANTIGKDARQVSGTSRESTQEETARLHAIQLLASFANAGSSFLPPLHAAGTLPALLSPSCLRSKQPQIVLAALRVLQSVAEASGPSFQTPLADIIFANDKLELFLHILSQPVPTPESEAQVSIVANLVRKLCREDRHQTVMVSSGILDALAMRLATFAVAAGYVLPKADVLAKSSGLSDYIPQPARSDRGLENVLGAIAAIITDSPFRACKLLFSPSILAVFPNARHGWKMYSEVPSEIPELPGLRPTRRMDSDPMDLLLPFIPSHSCGTARTNFSPPGASTSNETPYVKGRSATKSNTSSSAWNLPGDNAEVETEEAESPLIPWLIHLVRSRGGSESITAAMVLTSLFKAGFAYPSREATLGLLVIPVLLDTLNEVETNVTEDDLTALTTSGYQKLRLLAETPALLARLITDSEPLQKAAFDSDAAKTLCRLLKNTYDTPLPKRAPRPWSPHGNYPESIENVPSECQLGDAGELPGMASRIEIRASTLLAIGALATFKEEYRKAIIDEDAIPYIVESLQPSPGKPKQAKERKAEWPVNESIEDDAPSEYGNNPPSVIAQACYALRMLSRSVNILRTSLVDHMVAAPVFRLILRHADVEVQAAATATICNLVTNFSPMRDSLVEYGVLKVLCEHAHSLDPILRLNALWALKHLVDSAPVELKKKCVEELESGWLVRLICDDTEDEALFSARIKGDEMDEDTDMGLSEDQGRNWLSTSFYKASSPIRQQHESPILQMAEARLTALREAEMNPVRKARHDDLAIQEQGLGFIRNLIGGSHSSSSVDSTNDTTEMIDYLFNTLGQDRLFEILASKLRPKVLHAFNRRGIGTTTGTATTETRVVPPHFKVIEAVIYILVHIAASVPRHRQVVMAQTDLLRQLVRLLDPSASSPGVSANDSSSRGGGDKEVRLALCHLLNNLSWQDDDRDAPACSQRSSELRRLGFVSRLDHIAHADDELDVRERAKSALWQMKQGI
ncbi:hypothetical protein DL766_003440 [Monosporascus sp. MC13-8B]|uniref:Armadillo repeat-containing protein 8 n=1 Tax=Monosporascus cannonballus TaxID=155416 RepID=A0ABY0HGR2_9PEZI|nr:hypothetical protein DL763_006654 [Monosporascus cannonballus]RYO92734.1 hypothetical protein DL762_001440 [Monosporascus cannonballus]RYP33520.1 hypothetical protein DL766_003440 [Monosporascus sp. MC13-8B]